MLLFLNIEVSFTHQILLLYKVSEDKWNLLLNSRKYFSATFFLSFSSYSLYVVKYLTDSDWMMLQQVKVLSVCY